MPYTPPSQQSPVASRPESPAISRNSSYIRVQQPPAHLSFSLSPRPTLPRSSSSTSYLHRHRRSPSVTKQSAQDTSDATPFHKELPATEQHVKLESLRQSPPPVNDLAIPTGAVMSPPDSTQNSSDEEEVGKSDRTRELDNLAELQAAISIIEQHRESSPTRDGQETRPAKVALGIVVPPSSEPTPVQLTTPARPPLSKEARKISHSRSATESSAYLDLSRSKEASSSNSASDSDVDDSDVLAIKPPMVRKKSGELVRPALRPASSKRRPSSMPGTPTYSKAVHFDAHLEHVRHFLQVDRPLAVSAGTSPVETFENEMEFPFSGDESRPRTPSFQWELKLSNFPRESVDRSWMPVRMEKVFLSSDNKTLIGVVAVQNLAFNKTVVARFTLDYWKTTSEVVAEYNNDVRRKEANDGCDRFNFNIKLSDQANLETKTMFFCVRYNVNGQEYWDSNNNMNYQVDFTKKPLHQADKQKPAHSPSASLGALPRSRPSPPASVGRPRPKSTSFDNLASGFESQYDFGSFPQPVGDMPLRFRKPQAAGSMDGDDSKKSGKAPAQAFGNRYDFGASLSAAIQAASTVLGDRSGFQPKDQTKQAGFAADTSAESSDMTKSKVGEQGQKMVPKVGLAERRAANVSAGSDGPKPAALTSGKPSLQSQSYNELLDKYCFFGSAKASPAISKPGRNQVDGTDDYVSAAGGNSASSSGTDSPSPPNTPPTEEIKPQPLLPSPRISRSSSPATGSGFGARTTSPVSFGYPYRQPMQNSFFQESCAPTAIRG